MNILWWILFSLFVAIGVLNIFLVHALPGIVYLLFSMIYFPPMTSYIKRQLKIGVPPVLKIILAFLLLWFTLGVSDLMQIFEDAI